MTGERRPSEAALPKAVVVHGASGHGKVVADIARLTGLELAGFLDDDSAKIGGVHFGAPVLAWEAVVRLYERTTELCAALGIGNNAGREASFARLLAAGLTMPSLVHPSAVVAASSRLGAGTVVMAGAVVNPDAIVEEGCIINTGSVVEHDNRLGRFVHLSPNATLGGGVSIGHRTHIGLGAVVLPGVVVGTDVRVGAGAVVNRKIADGATVVGIPARPLAPRAP